MIREHEDIVKKYKETIENFHKKLNDIETARNQLAEQRVEVDKNNLNAINQRDVLNLQKL